MPLLDDFQDASVLVYNHILGLLESNIQYAENDMGVQQGAFRRTDDNSLRIDFNTIEHDVDQSSLGREARLVEVDIVVSSKVTDEKLIHATAAAMSMQVEQIMSGTTSENGVHLVDGNRIECEWESNTYADEEEAKGASYLAYVAVRYSVTYYTPPGEPGALI